ncbi:hypothetical protein Adu01nite_43990 [Paractinoplanes durhamensis]|uniref:PH domain-containing protein n=2 Tax=Paractinoplanes durhamensis TaxID=113563 RepID=A0ABQ3YZN3_9ACTN|nr:hypothetical protein Adu01nite_43990 [Actinoplanes durhamensis]
MARYSRGVLVAGLSIVAAAVLAGLLGVVRPAAITVLVVLTVTPVVLLLATFLTPSIRRPPAAFAVADGAFRTPRTIMYAFCGVAHLGLLGLLVLLTDDFAALSLKDKATYVVGTAFFVIYVPAMWRGVGLTITAEGIRADKHCGTVVVPWAAIGPVPPIGERNEVRLNYRDPGLVRVSGWTPNRRELLCDGTDAKFAAAAIGYYAAHPEERAGIGTPAAQDELRAALDAVPAEKPASSSRGEKVALIVIGLVFFVVAVAGDVWVSEILGDESLLGWLVHLVAGAIGLAAGWCVIDGVKGLRRRT